MLRFHSAIFIYAVTLPLQSWASPIQAMSNPNLKLTLQIRCDSRGSEKSQVKSVTACGLRPQFPEDICEVIASPSLQSEFQFTEEGLRIKKATEDGTVFVGKVDVSQFNCVGKVPGTEFQAVSIEMNPALKIKTRREPIGACTFNTRPHGPRLQRKWIFVSSLQEKEMILRFSEVIFAECLPI